MTSWRKTRAQKQNSAGSTKCEALFAKNQSGGKAPHRRFLFS
jgi:hypothetical protein